MADIEKKDFNGIYIEITSEGDGNIQFGAGLDFTEEATDEFKEYMEMLLAGLFGVLSTDVAAVENLGKHIMEQENFKWRESGIFHPEENGVKGDVVDFLDFHSAKFDPQKNRKH